MRRVRTKICGVTTPDEAAAAADAGADAIGLVFYEQSRRHLGVAAARDVVRAVPLFVTRVGLFLDPEPADVRQVLARVDIDLLQFHGNESAEFCRSFGKRYVKAVPMGDDDIDLAAWSVDFHDAQALLLDAHRAGEAGGQGVAFDWQASALGDSSRAGASPMLPLVVAGGLNADNVADAIARLRPYAVDVSSGVEDADGAKSPARIRAFIDATLEATNRTTRHTG